MNKPAGNTGRVPAICLNSREKTLTRGNGKPTPVAAGRVFGGRGCGLVKKTPGWPVVYPTHGVVVLL